MSFPTQETDLPQSLETPLPNAKIDVSIVVPISERCGDLFALYRDHAQVLKDLGLTFEFIFVVEEAETEYVQSLRSLVALGEPIQVLVLRRSFGEAMALAAGFEHARAEVLVTLPAYSQTATEGIKDVLQKIQEGYDVVVTQRWPRRDSIINRIQNVLFHALLGWLTGVHFHDLSSTLKGIRRRVIQEIRLYGDLHRFFPLLACQRGFKIVEIQVAQHEADLRMRIYHPGIYVRRLLDLLTVVFLFKFTQKPLRFFGLIGAGLFGVGATISGVLAVEKMVMGVGLGNRPLLVLGVLLMVLGVQCGSIGLLGELLIFTHARKFRNYTVEKILR